MLTQVEDTWASLIQIPDAVRAVAFSPDGKQIASGSDDKTIKLWNATTGGLKKTFTGHSNWVQAIAFSPDGKQIASGSEDKTIKLWGATTGGLQKPFVGHSDWVQAVAFSPDGKQIASGSADESIKLWDLTEALKVSRLGSAIGRIVKFRACKKIKTSEAIEFLNFSEDGQRLVTNLGLVKIEGALANILHYHLEVLWVRNQWVYYGVMPILRLASDFEAQSYDQRGNQVAIGLRNGRVLSFEIDRKSL
jgi:WD40 repeat protein